MKNKELATQINELKEVTYMVGGFSASTIISMLNEIRRELIKINK
jgi:hypothetical protein